MVVSTPLQAKAVPKEKEPVLIKSTLPVPVVVRVIGVFRVVGPNDLNLKLAFCIEKVSGPEEKSRFPPLEVQTKLPF